MLIVLQAISYFGAPLVAWLTIRYRQHQRIMVLLGCAMCVFSLVGGSFATEIWHLVMTQGLFYGMGVMIIYYPILSMLTEWFVVKQGRAYGIL